MTVAPAAVEPPAGQRALGPVAAVGAAMLLVASALGLSAVVAPPASAESEVDATIPTPALLGSGNPRALLEAAVAASGTPHVGSVTVVSFTADGPRVADVDVRVGSMGELELRRARRWLVDGPGEPARQQDGVGSLPAVSGLSSRSLDLDTLLEGWIAHVGSPRALDTGPAVPVHLVRRSGAPIEEVLYVDDATSLLVRRETRAADGSVLRVVAYTDLGVVDAPGPAAVVSTVAGPSPTMTAAASEDGYVVPEQLDGGFELIGAMHTDGMVTARYGDGLSVLSVYQQPGVLDPRELDGAAITHVADRDVWTWVGGEPLTLVWTSASHTWTAVTDAPLEVVEGAIGSLPGELVGHDVPSRIRRGLDKAWYWLTSWTR